MNIYLISQEVNNDYDTYDSAVVCAKDEDNAKAIHPDGTAPPDIWYSLTTWTQTDNVKVKLIGKAAKGIKRGVICASYNAG